jgi:hypothetical protein
MSATVQQIAGFSVELIGVSKYRVEMFNMTSYAGPNPARRAHAH